MVDIGCGGAFIPSPAGILFYPRPFASGSSGSLYRSTSGSILKLPVLEDLRFYLEIEASVYQRLGRHPNILKLLDDNFCGSGGLLLEYHSRGNMENYVKSSQNRISIDLVRKWCLQLAEGLAYMHNRRVIHLDLEPGNGLMHSTSLVAPADSFD